MTCPFILNDNIICFIAFLAVFLVKKKGLPKKHKELRTPGPPPYLGLSPNIFLSASLSRFRGGTVKKAPCTSQVGYVGLLMTAFKVLNQSVLM